MILLLLSGLRSLAQSALRLFIFPRHSLTKLTVNNATKERSLVFFPVNCHRLLLSLFSTASSPSFWQYGFTWKFRIFFVRYKNSLLRELFCHKYQIHKAVGPVITGRSKNIHWLWLEKRSEKRSCWWQSGDLLLASCYVKVNRICNLTSSHLTNEYIRYPAHPSSTHPTHQ